jgi:hypothetical protein
MDAGVAEQGRGGVAGAAVGPETDPAAPAWAAFWPVRSYPKNCEL